MTDCYSILGVSRHASQAEIRAAYLARMKLLHPDARRDGSDPGEGDAGEITFAYWQLRDADRRADHDLALFSAEAPSQRRPPRSANSAGRKRGAMAKRSVPAARTAPKGSRPRRLRSGRRLRPMRAAAGAAACVTAALAFLVAFTSIESPGTGPAKAASSSIVLAASPAAARRANDPHLILAAGDAFRDVVRRSGGEGARRYARQCLLELTARPTMTILDFCVAFDDEAADWELAQTERTSRFFAEAQRFGRYRSAALDLRPGEVREALEADVAFFADAVPEQQPHIAHIPDPAAARHR